MDAPAARFLAVAAGGALGAVLRYAVSLLVARAWSGEFPLATFLVNVAGSFALGVVVAFGAERGGFDPLTRLALATGVLGAFTTFSTFEYETSRLLDQGAYAMAGLNVLASLAAGLVALRVGAALAR